MHFVREGAPFLVEGLRGGGSSSRGIRPKTARKHPPGEALLAELPAGTMCRCPCQSERRQSAHKCLGGRTSLRIRGVRRVANRKIRKWRFVDRAGDSPVPFGFLVPQRADRYHAVSLRAKFITNNYKLSVTTFSGSVTVRSKGCFSRNIVVSLSLADFFYCFLGWDRKDASSRVLSRPPRYCCILLRVRVLCVLCMVVCDCFFPMFLWAPERRSLE